MKPYIGLVAGCLVTLAWGSRGARTECPAVATHPPQTSSDQPAAQQDQQNDEQTQPFSKSSSSRNPPALKPRPASQPPSRVGRTSAGPAKPPAGPGGRSTGPAESPAGRPDAHKGGPDHPTGPAAGSAGLAEAPGGSEGGDQAAVAATGRPSDTTGRRSSRTAPPAPRTGRRSARIRRPSTRRRRPSGTTGGTSIRIGKRCGTTGSRPCTRKPKERTEVGGPTRVAFGARQPLTRPRERAGIHPVIRRSDMTTYTTTLVGLMLAGTLLARDPRAGPKAGEGPDVSEEPPAPDADPEARGPERTQVNHL